MKNGRSYLIYAAVLGVLAAASASWYLSRAEAAANPTEPVVVARANIPARAVLSEDNVTVILLPKGAVLPEAAATMGTFIGKTTKQSISQGEQILASKLFRDRSESGASFVLPEGDRAVAINVNELIAAGGLVLPGDKVDVIGSCVVPVKGSSQDKESQVARVVYSLQKLEVLAVAQNVVGEEAIAPQNAVRAQNPSSLLSLPRDAQAQPSAKTVTLALTPDQSEKLILLENHPDCRLRLALRAANDSSQASSGVMEFDPVDSMQPIIQP